MNEEMTQATTVGEFAQQVAVQGPLDVSPFLVEQVLYNLDLYSLEDQEPTDLAIKNGPPENNHELAEAINMAANCYQDMMIYHSSALKIHLTLLQTTEGDWQHKYKYLVDQTEAQAKKASELYSAAFTNAFNMINQ